MELFSPTQTSPKAAHRAPLRLSRVLHPQFSTPIQATIHQVESDDDEVVTAQTIHLMAKYAREDSLSPIVRRAAAEAILTAKDGRAASKAAACWEWIRAHVRFQLDSITAAPVSETPDQAELLIRPVDILTMPQMVGDCDDQSMLCASMLRSLGIDSSFKTVAAERTTPDLYSHVYVVAHTPEGDLSLDCSHGPHPGWEVTPTGKTRIWRIEAMQHLGAFDWGKIAEIGVKAGSEIAVAHCCPRRS
jgi:transglutaminase-like putative cysteine protease